MSAAPRFEGDRRSPGRGSAFGGTAASVLINREMVGTYTTTAKPAGSDPSGAASARQSPNASMIARSKTILPGSWVANGLRPDAPRVRPVITAVPVSSIPPA